MVKDGAEIGGILSSFGADKYYSKKIRNAEQFLRGY
jgi:hypothetical protein